MIYSDQIQTHGRSAMAARDILSLKRRGGIGAFMLIFLLTIGVLAGSSSLMAEEQNSTVATTVAKVNINTADASTLAANLKGVGESRAMEIVRYREAYGPFASADELTEVKGIGPATLEMNREAITLE